MQNIQLNSRNKNLNNLNINNLNIPTIQTLEYETNVSIYLKLKIIKIYKCLNKFV